MQKQFSPIIDVNVMNGPTKKGMFINFDSKGLGSGNSFYYSDKQFHLITSLQDNSL